MSEVADPRVGRILENRYTITRRIADGGMASVYLAQDGRLERTVAIKIIHSQLAQGPHREQFLHRFHAEAKAAAALSNPHIVQVYDTGDFDGLQYIVMEYVHGVNLRQSMETNPTFSLRDTLRILSETLDGLSSAHHAGLVHRDIKPENILINSRGHVQITDFGLAKAVSDATMGTTGLLLGTAAYLAPEMIESNKATPQGDLYSVGIMGYEMLTGVVPFTSDNPITMVFKHVHDDVPSLTATGGNFPDPLVRLIARLAARDPQLRPENASEALEELQKAVSEIPRESLFYKFSPAPAIHSSDDSAASAAPLLPASRDATTALTPLPTTQDAPTQEFLHSTGAPVLEHTSVMDSEAVRRSGEAASSAKDPVSVENPPQPPSAAKDSRAEKKARAKANMNSAHSSKRGNQGTPGNSSKKKRHRLLVGIIAAVVAILAGVIVWWWFWGPGSYWVVPEASDQPCTEQSCTLSGASYSKYQRTLTALGIEYRSTRNYSDTVEVGDIISADPDVNGRVTKRGGALVLSVSKGVKKLTVPSDLLNCSSTEDPEATLTSLGFSDVTVTEEYSLDTAEGCAISTTAELGASIAHNTAIGLTVSKGPKPVEIPGLAGTSQKDATTTLEDLKLSVKVEEDYSDSIAKGSVISSNPSENATAHWGDTVTLTVSKGPETVTMPSVVGTSKEAAVEKLKALGLSVTTQSSQLGETLHLVLKQSVEGNTKVRLRDSSGNPTVITLTIV